MRISDHPSADAAERERSITDESLSEREMIEMFDRAAEELTDADHAERERLIAAFDAARRRQS